MRHMRLCQDNGVRECGPAGMERSELLFVSRDSAHGILFAERPSRAHILRQENTILFAESLSRSSSSRSQSEGLYMYIYTHAYIESQSEGLYTHTHTHTQRVSQKVCIHTHTHTHTYMKSQPEGVYM